MRPEITRQQSDGGGTTVLILSGVRGDTRRYRTFHPYEQLQLAGADSLLAHITDPELPAKIDQSHIVIFHRTTFDRYVDHLLQSIQQHNGLAILDIDDLVFDPQAFPHISSPDFQDPVRAALYQEDIRRNRLTLERCQAVIASTQYLAEAVKPYPKPAWVHRNAFSLEMLDLSEEAYKKRSPLPGKTVIGYASGTPTHDRDFQLARPALVSILQHYPQTELWLIGPIDSGKEWGPLEHRVRHIPLVPWRRLPALLACFDINIAPLVIENPFGQSKSEIKYMEAGLVRVPTIASPTNAFQHAIQSGENGFLASQEDEWIEALATLVEQADLRNAMGERAYTHILQRYQPLVRAGELVETLNEVHTHAFGVPFRTPFSPGELELKQASQPAHYLSPQLELRPTLAQMALYTLRHRGLKTMLMQVWIYFRRGLAHLLPYRKVNKKL